MPTHKIKQISSAVFWNDEDIKDQRLTSNFQVCRAGSRSRAGNDSGSKEDDDGKEGRELEVHN
jgi:hypothetical protein